MIVIHVIIKEVPQGIGLVVDGQGKEVTPTEKDLADKVRDAINKVMPSGTLVKSEEVVVDLKRKSPRESPSKRG